MKFGGGIAATKSIRHGFAKGWTEMS